MTLELTAYILLLFIAILVATFRLNRLLYYILQISVMLFWSFAIRTSGFDIDMNEYASSMKFESYTFYYLREPVYWFSARFLYNIIQSDILVFIFIDLLGFILLLYFSKKAYLPDYFPLLWLIFFPSVMGIQNVYRQYNATYFMLLFFLSSKNNESIKSALWLLISGLTHNMFLLFAPIYFIFKGNQRLKLFLSCVLVLIALPFMIGSKSSNDTGELGVFVYILCMLAILFIYCFVNKLKLYSDDASYFYLILYSIALTSVSGVLMGSAQSKRIGMICLLLTLISNTYTIEKIQKNRVFIRIIYLLVAFSPTLLFSSSRDFLFTVNL